MATVRFLDCNEATMRKRLRRYGFQCFWCGNRPGKDFHHVRPQSPKAGGSDEWNNLVWACRECHRLLDEFCGKYWNNSGQADRIRTIKACSVEACLQFIEGTINKKKSTEEWSFGGIGHVKKEGKELVRPRAPDDIWAELSGLRKHMPINCHRCLDYLRQFAAYTNEALSAHPYCGYDGPVVIAAPSLEALITKAREIEAMMVETQKPKKPRKVRKQPDPQKELQEEIQAIQEWTEKEDEFFHKAYKLPGLTILI